MSDPEILNIQDVLKILEGDRLFAYFHESGLVIMRQDKFDDLMRLVGSLCMYRQSMIAIGKRKEE